MGTWCQRVMIMTTEATEKEAKVRASENVLVSAGNLDLDYVISGVEYHLRFQSIADGSKANPGTFKIEGFKHNITINGVTLRELVEKALGQIRIDFAGPVRKGTAAEAKALNGGKTELKEMLGKHPRAVREKDPIKAAEKALEAMSAEALEEYADKLQALINAAKAKQAGIATIETE